MLRDGNLTSEGRLVHYQHSPSKRKTSGCPSTSSRRVSSSVLRAPHPIYLKFKTNAGLARRWRIPERRGYSAEKNLPGRDKLGGHFLVRACSELSVWVLCKGHLGPKARGRSYRSPEWEITRKVKQIRQEAGICKKYLRMIPWEQVPSYYSCGLLKINGQKIRTIWRHSRRPLRGEGRQKTDALISAWLATENSLRSFLPRSRMHSAVIISATE